MSISINVETTLLCDKDETKPDEPTWNVSGRSDAEVRHEVKKIVAKTELTHVPEKRVDQRFAFPRLLTITPIDDHSLTPVGEPIQVVGKWLAERGLDFFHTGNLPFRRAIVSFEDSAAHLVLNISWSRFLAPGWYDSGGRFTHIVRCESDTRASA